ncbi:hypothetical protein GCM10009837_62530 [Streptomyces durmitorensis]|uniref:DUF3311 domain-containing protein n=1 Tax=Streptomyces durmitorensis TaxID=319947 RepID=A0ABY4Q4M1_9ACTN|nr:DUF3311 domain-containing protein [Streptomyces durmitorensis]UQT60117.1 DUF3311 domain-containing protein [Streptomyces durmitorensis]
MPPTADDGVKDSAGDSTSDPAASPLDGLPTVRGVARPSLWLLLVPVLLYGAAPLVANRIEPRILGVPFLLAWVIAATVISPLVIWLAARLDPAYRTNAVEPIPADDLADDLAGTGPYTEGGRR